MKRILWIVLAAGALAALLVLLRPPRVPVEAGVVVNGPLAETVDEEGRTRVRERFVVSAPVAGRVARITLREGDSVSRGTVVARISPAPLDARGQDVAVARLEAATAASRGAAATVVRGRAALEQARRDRGRIEDLARQGIATPEQLEQARLAEISRARELESAEFAAQAASHEMEAARAAMTGADPEQDCPDVVEVRSPIAGRVLRVPERSERVLAAGSPLVEVGNPGRLEVVAEILSSDAVRIQVSDPVTIDEWGGEPPLDARVRTIEPAAFTKLSALGVEEQRVRVIMDLPEATPLGDGFRVEVRVITWESANALKVPTVALFRRGSRWAVFTLSGKRAHERAVEIGHRNPAEAEVLAGLAAGDTVVLHPSDQLADGARVTIP